MTEKSQHSGNELRERKHMDHMRNSDGDLHRYEGPLLLLSLTVMVICLGTMAVALINENGMLAFAAFFVSLPAAFVGVFFLVGEVLYP